VEVVETIYIVNKQTLLGLGDIGVQGVRKNKVVKGGGRPRQRCRFEQRRQRCGEYKAVEVSRERVNFRTQLLLDFIQIKSVLIHNKVDGQMAKPT
jgi:hypothetical protein